MGRNMNKKGQSILSEYVMIFFVVIAALVAMTSFVRRGLNARIHDARNYMIDSVSNNNVCDANCVQAAGGKIAYEYEPYYTQMIADVYQNSQASTGITNGSAAEIGAIYTKSLNNLTRGTSTSFQLPPACADGANSDIVNCANL